MFQARKKRIWYRQKLAARGAMSNHSKNHSSRTLEKPTNYSDIGYQDWDMALLFCVYYPSDYVVIKFDGSCVLVLH